MSAFFFLLLAFAPAILMLGLLARRRRLQRALSALPALSVLLYALPYEGVLIAARFWQVSAAYASGISILGIPLERLALDAATILLAGFMAQWLWQANYSES
jgi:lycopene cyclase domain-containing protein